MLLLERSARCCYARSYTDLFARHPEVLFVTRYKTCCCNSPINWRYTDMTIRVILADEYQMLLDALSSFLHDEKDIRVVGVTTDGRDVLELVESLRPDVVVMSVYMQGMNGIQATRQLVKDYPKVKVVVMSSYAQKEHVIEVLDAGASAFVIKENSGRELVDALYAVMKGQKYLCTDVVDMVVSHASHYTMRIIPQLGPREREVLQLLAEGSTSPEIANRLFISPSTVDVHRRNIMKKLDLHNVAGLTKYAVRNGLTYV